jgi:hypothetical protein
MHRRMTVNVDSRGTWEEASVVYFNIRFDIGLKILSRIMENSVKQFPDGLNNGCFLNLSPMHKPTRDSEK